MLVHKLLAALLLLGAVGAAYAHQDDLSAGSNGASAQLTVSHRDLAQSPAASPCSLSPGLFSTARFTLASINASLSCLNTVRIQYDIAWGQAISLSNVFQEFFVFVNTAINPSNSSESNAFGIKPWNEKVDLVGGLRQLADSWPENQTVGLADVALPINDLFNRVRDAHTIYQGASSRFGTIFGNVLGNLYLVLYDVSNQHQVLAVTLKAKGQSGINATAWLTSPGLASTEDVTKVVKSVDGRPFMDWFLRTMITSPTFNFPHHSLGSRINSLLEDFWLWSLASTGDLTPLVGKQYKVQYEDGSTGLWTWAVQFPVGGWSAEQVKNLTEDANTPGIPFSALVKGLELLVNVTVPDDWNDDSSASNGRRRAMREQQQEPLGRLTQLSHDADELFAARRMAQQRHNVTKIYSLDISEEPVLIGEYYIASTGRAGYAVWKLTTFYFFDWDMYEAAWRDFVAQAQAAGVKRLIFDVVGNRGGVVTMGFGALLSLFPNTPNPNDLLLDYDRIVGPAAEYWVGPAMDSIMAVQNLSSDPAWLEGRAQALAANITEFQELVNVTSGINMAISVMLNSTSADLGFCTSRDTCQQTWVNATDRLDRVLKVLAPLVASGTAPTVAQLSDLYAALYAGMKLMNPFTVHGDAQVYERPVYRLRGGVNSTYTRPFKLVDFPFNVSEYRLPAHPFNKIIALSNGLCGSTCGQFTAGSWFHSLQHPEGPTFRYVTYGGTGKRGEISPISFPGGNVVGEDFVTQSWGAYGMSYAAARWTGVQQHIDVIDALGDLLPTPPVSNDDLTPRFSQSQSFIPAMGPKALPLEYYQIPSDYHIREWYLGARIVDANVLPELYTQAAKYFAWMPKPQKTSRRAAA